MGRGAIWFGAMLLALVAGPALAQRDVENAPDPWVHAATGTKFPAQIAGFERGRVTEYSEDGTDASASYSLRRDGKFVVVTLYVYPAGDNAPCAEIYADARSHIDKRKGARLVREGRELAPAGQGAPTAYYARYAIPAGGMSEGSPAVTSDLYLHCPARGGFLVKYRASGSEGFEFGPDVTRLLRAMSWPETLGK